MKIIYDSKDEKSRFCELTARMTLQYREILKNYPDAVLSEMLDELNDKAVSGAYPECFADEEYKIIKGLLYENAR